MKALRITGLVLIAIVIFGAGIGSGIFIDRLNSNVITSSQIDKADLQLMNQAWDLFTRSTLINLPLHRKISPTVQLAVW